MKTITPMDVGNSSVAPKWLLKSERITQRQWRSRKRKQFRALLKAVDEFRQGCAYIPRSECPNTGRGDMLIIKTSLARMQRVMSAKEWK